MSIDKKPAVGRYIFLESRLLGAYTSFQAGLITRIVRSRIYYKPYDVQIRVNGAPVEERFCIKCSAVCDTVEEVNQIRDFTSRCLHETRALQHKLKAEYLTLIGEKPCPKPPLGIHLTGENGEEEW